MVVLATPLEARRAFLSRLAPDEEGLWSIRVVEGEEIPYWRRAFWTARQRQGHNLHEISYRACYKPQLPGLFIQHLTATGDRVYDPFSGRGTTALEAALQGRQVAANDINPLSVCLAKPRLTPPTLQALQARLQAIPKAGTGEADWDLSMFYHQETEAELRALRAYLLTRQSRGEMDAVDAWIQMVATNRLTGHSPGFFSVYTLPPNQAVSAAKQREINAKREQVPPYRDVHAIILKKSRQLLATLTEEERARLNAAAASGVFLVRDAAHTPEIPSESVQLTVTSPPFLDVVQYKADNWLRCWFCGLDAEHIGTHITMARTVSAWSEVMGAVMRELYRVTQPGGYVAFEVGEVKGGTVRLDEVVLPLGMAAGFEPLGVLINEQTFTKTANIWGVDNNDKGTNSNRIALFGKTYR